MRAVTEPRDARIQKQFDDYYLRDVGIAVSCPEVPYWKEHIVDDMPTVAHFGWAWPVPNPKFDETKPAGHANPIAIFGYCPQIIDEQTRWMDDDRFEKYLDIIHWIVDMHLTYWDIEDSEGRHAMILSEIPAEGALGLLHEIEVLAAMQQQFDE